MKPWAENDELARELIAEGHQWENWLAGYLGDFGCKVRIPKQTIRDSISDAYKYRGTIDMHVNGFRVQCKSRANGIDWDPLFLCSAAAWRLNKTYTDVWFVVCQKTRKVIGISGPFAAKHGKIVETYDTRRETTTHPVAIPLGCFTDGAKIARWLAANHKRRPGENRDDYDSELDG